MSTTFANELDRLIQPSIEFILDLNHKAEESCPGELCSEYELPANKYHLLLTRNHEMVGYVDKVYLISDESQTSDGDIVYEREPNYTKVCRPGAWMKLVFDYAAPLMAARDWEDIKMALEKIEIRHRAFDSIEVNTSEQHA